MAEPVSASTHINASPEAVYALVSDLPRMGEWSPENTGGKWIEPGKTFRGTNKNGKRSWSTKVIVAEAKPGESFAFDVVAGGLKVARWSYRITPADGGCDVTEQWDDRRNGVFKAISGRVTGVPDRAAFTKRSIETTLANLKAAAEG